MKVSVDWQDGMLFQATGESGFPVALDGAPESGGRSKGARPMELLLMGMAGCTAMDVLAILAKMRLQPGSFTVEVDAGRAAEYPQVFTTAVLTYRLVMAKPQREKVLRAITLSLEKYCSAVNTLKRGMAIRWRCVLNGAAGEEQAL